MTFCSNLADGPFAAFQRRRIQDAVMNETQSVKALPPLSSESIEIQIVSKEKVQSVAKAWIPLIMTLAKKDPGQYEVTYALLQSCTQILEKTILCAIAVEKKSKKALSLGVFEKRSDPSAESLFFFVRALCTHPLLTRKGIGRTVLRFGEMKAKEQGLLEARLSSTRRAKKFYEREGYRSDESGLSFCMVKQLITEEE